MPCTTISGIRAFDGMGAFLATVLCLAIAAGIPAEVASAQTEGRRAAGVAAGEPGDQLWISTMPLDESRHVLIVVDPIQRQVAIYHLDASAGTLSLKSTRDIGPDLQLGEFNAQDPKPSALRKMLDMKAGPARGP
ncbi:MAG: hypothetical protein ACKOYJ_04495 [Planctomycetia bacterium]